MIMDDRFNQAVNLQPTKYRVSMIGVAASAALNQKGRSEILEVFSDGFDWEG